MKRLVLALVGATVGFVAGTFAAALVAVIFPLMAAFSMLALPFIGAVRGVVRLRPVPSKSIADQLSDALDEVL